MYQRKNTFNLFSIKKARPLLGAMFALLFCFSAAQIARAQADENSAGSQAYLDGLQYDALNKAAPPGIQSAIITVMNGNDSGAGSLRQAVIDAAAGDTINFNFNGTVNLTSGEIVINKNLRINGPGARNLTVRRDPAAAANFRIFNVTGVNAIINGLTIRGGRTTVGDGGGIYKAPGGRLNLQGVTMTDNIANGAGGCVFVESEFQTTNSTYSGNSTTGGFNGGCLQLFAVSAGSTPGQSVIIVNSTFSGNTASENGGAISNVNQNSTLGLSTVAGNTANGASFGAGGVFNQTANGGVAQVILSIIALNSSPNINAPDAAGTFTSQGSNFIGKNNGSTGFPAGNPNANQDIVGTTAAPLDPLLGALADNGGPTDTRRPANNSPVIDKGNLGGTATDQRFLTRPVDIASIPNATGGDGTDIGAIELQEADFQPDLSITMTVTPNTVAQFGTLTYNITVTNNGGAPAANIVLNQTDFTTFSNQPQLQVLSLTAPAGWTCQTTQSEFTTPFAGNNIQCQGATLAPGATANSTFTKRLTAGLPNGTVINHNAAVSTTTPEVTTANNTATDTTTVTGNPPGRP